MQMVFVSQKELGIVALDDFLDFFLKRVDVVDELVVVLGDLLFVGEFFGLS